MKNRHQRLAYVYKCTVHTTFALSFFYLLCVYKIAFIIRKACVVPIYMDLIIFVCMHVRLFVFIFLFPLYCPHRLSTHTIWILFSTSFSLSSSSVFIQNKKEKKIKINVVHFISSFFEIYFKFIDYFAYVIRFFRFKTVRFFFFFFSCLRWQLFKQKLWKTALFSSF